MRAIQAGVDVDGDGGRELDPARIYYLGHSLRAMYGMFAFVYEPAIRAAAFSAGAGTLADNRRLSPPARPAFAAALAARTPSLINDNGLTSIDGSSHRTALPRKPSVAKPDACRGRGSRSRAIQQVIDRVTWVEQVASSVAAAPLLRRSPLAGRSVRPFILQFARSDVSSPNPSSMEILRAGRFADRAHLYRHDLNVGDPGVANYPHLYLLTVQIQQILLVSRLVRSVRSRPSLPVTARPSFIRSPDNSVADRHPTSRRSVLPAASSGREGAGAGAVAA